MLLNEAVRNMAMQDATQGLWNAKVNRCPNKFVDELEPLSPISEHPTINQSCHCCHRLSCAEVDNGIQRQIVKTASENCGEVKYIAGRAVEARCEAGQNPMVRHTRRSCYSYFFGHRIQSQCKRALRTLSPILNQKLQHHWKSRAGPEQGPL